VRILPLREIPLTPEAAERSAFPVWHLVMKESNLATRDITDCGLREISFVLFVITYSLFVSGGNAEGHANSVPTAY